MLNVVVGSGSEIGDAIVEHPLPRVVSFTGSTPVGEAIAGKAGVKRLALELGGNGPMVVLDDADLELAVDAAVFGAFFHQGQICMIANRLIVDRRRARRVRRAPRRPGASASGSATRRTPTTELGPIINHGQLASVQDKVAPSGRGRRRAAARRRSGRARSGCACRRTCCSASNDVATAREEVFGPVITVIRADGEDDALPIANDTEYGLSSAVFTRDGSAACGSPSASRRA